jgi:YHS domain-containing protein
MVQYIATTPCVVYQGQTVYFCLPICKAGLEADPLHSCLALSAGR